MKRWDIGAQVMFAAVVPAALLALALAAFFTYVRISALDRELHEHGAAIARQLAPASEYGVFSGNKDFLRQLAETAVTDGGVDGVAIFDRSGTVMIRSGRLHEDLLHDPKPGRQLEMRHIHPDTLAFVAPVGGMATSAEDLGGAEGGAGTGPVIGAVLVQMSLEPLALRKAELISAAIAISLAGLGIAIWLARRLANDVARPVLDLSRTVGLIKSGDLGVRSDIEAGGVLKILEAGINDMASSLEEGQRDLEKRVAAATAELQRQKELAEQANRTKTQFLAAASHDLRQPIQAAGLFVSALRLRSKDEDTQRLVSRIERAHAGLEAVLDGLLDISRLDSGAVTPRIELFPANRLLDRLRDAFAATAAESGLRLGVMPSSVWCLSDPLLLERVLSNLVSNALRYTARGGVVVGCRRAGGWVHFQVWDSGSGIPEDKRAEIFREFVQLENPQSGRDKGLGLGLAIVERLSRLLDHPLRLRSVVGKGTVFSVQVRRGRAPRQLPTEAAARAGGNSDFGGLCILAVDDDPDVLESLVAFLSQIGARVLTAASAAQARQVMSRAEQVHVLLSDYRLPDGDGVSIVRELQARYGRHMPGIIISGETAEDVLQRVSASGLRLLHKPVPAETLHQALQELLAGEAGGGLG
jgi:signal transduction histidine kinase